MHPVSRMTASMAIATLALLGAACGGGGSGKSSPTVKVGSSPVSGEVTPFPTPVITGNQITSEKKGYTATLPDGWKVRPNFVQTADASVDAIFEPLFPGAMVQANIQLNCIVLRAASEAQREEQLKTNTARQGLNKDIQVSQRKISGIDATVLSYSFQSQNQQNIPPLDKQDIIFTSPKCDWIVTTTTLQGERGKYQATFDAFLNSFKVQS